MCSFGIDTNIDPNLDPSLWDAQPTTGTGSGESPTGAMHTLDSLNIVPPTPPVEPPCACLSVMYLTLTDLQAITSFAFPAVIPPLRRAITTTSTIMRCDKCPQQPFTAIQNVLTMTSLLSAIAERYHKVLQSIDTEAMRLEHLGEKKTFRVGDTDPLLQHLHTGTEDCPMGFNIELEPQRLETIVQEGAKNRSPGWRQ